MNPALDVDWQYRTRMVQGARARNGELGAILIGGDIALKAIPSPPYLRSKGKLIRTSLRFAVYVEAIGGKLELTVKVPAKPPVRIEHLGDLTQRAPKASGRRIGARRRVA